MHVHDLVVIGVGGMGSAAFCAAARRGMDVIGIDQFGPAHDRGSSHGQTRIIRTAYFEHPSYVPMARRAFELWREMERNSNSELLRVTGLLQIGSPDSAIINGVRKSARSFQLPVTEMTPREIESRWPAFEIPPDAIGLFEESAGYLRVERCCATMIRVACEAGGQYQSKTHVESWHVDDGGIVRVQTNQGPIAAKKAIFAGGPWSNSLVPDLELDLKIVRKQQQWLQVDRADIHEAAGFCCFLFDTDQGCFYGFPAIDHLGMKFAEHTGGQAISDANKVDRALDQLDLDRVNQFVQKHFRFGRTRLTHFSTCMYTKSVDEHFIIDRHPRFQQIAIVAGLSGHGFKFAPVIAEHLLKLLDGLGDPDCAFLGLHRFGR